MCHLALAILEPIKDVIANGHDKLNSLMIAQAPSYFLPKIIKIGWRMWKIKQAQSVLFSVYSMTEETKFLGFMFPQIVQRQGEVG